MIKRNAIIIAVDELSIRYVVCVIFVSTFIFTSFIYHNLKSTADILCLCLSVAVAENGEARDTSCTSRSALRHKSYYEALNEYINRFFCYSASRTAIFHVMTAINS